MQVHLVDPKAEVAVPAHCLHPICPVILMYVFTAQLLHPANVSVRFTLVYVPTGHAISLVEPSGQ